MNIAFYVSFRATRLKNIINDHRFGRIRDSVKLVYTDNLKSNDLNENVEIKNIELVGLQFDELPKGMDKNEYLSKDMLKKCTDSRIDYIFSFGDHILKGRLLIEFKNKIINFHPSVLPLYPGRKSIDQAVISNSFLYGNTAHFIDEGIDTGPIIMQNILSHYDYKGGSPYEIILNNQIEMFYQIYSWLDHNRLKIDGNRCVIENVVSESVYFPRLENV